MFVSSVKTFCEILRTISFSITVYYPIPALDYNTDTSYLALSNGEIFIMPDILYWDLCNDEIIIVTGTSYRSLGQ